MRTTGHPTTPRSAAPRRPFLLAVLVLLAACSSTATRTAGSTTLPVAPTSASAATTTTAAPTTTVATVPSGWSILDLADASPFSAPSCCGANWYGTPSPAFPAEGEALADGAYRIVGEWPADVSGGVLDLELARFESCATLGADGCADPTDPAVDALGVDLAVLRPLSLTLDDRLRVVVWGYRGLDDTAYLRAASVGNGADLLSLVQHLTTAFDDVFLQPVRSGVDPDAVIDVVLAAPTGGFQPAPDAGGLFVYVDEQAAGDVPHLLYQVVYTMADPLASRATDSMYLVSLVVEDGVPTLYVYAGFLS